MDWYSLLQPVRFLTRFLHTAHSLHRMTLFITQEILMILENSFSQNACLIMLSYVVQLGKHKQPMKISIHRFLHQAARDPQYKNHSYFSLWRSYLRGSSNELLASRFFYVGFCCIQCLLYTLLFQMPFIDL